MSLVMQLLEQQGIGYLLKPSSFPLLLLLFLLFIPFLIKLVFFNTQTSSKNLPPSPPKLPIIGNLHQFGSHPHHSLLSLAQRHGPLMHLRLGNRSALIVSSANGAREIMKTHDLVFANRPEVKINRKLLYDLKDVSVSPYGELWRQLKSICVLRLLSNKKVQSFSSIREEETALMMKKIRKSCSLSSSSSSVMALINLSEMFSTLTNDVVCRSAFGRKYGEEESGKKFKGLLTDFLELLGSANVEDFLPWLAWINRFNGKNAKVDRVAREIDEFLETVVQDRLDRLEKEGIIGGGGGSDQMEVDGETREDFVDILIKIYKNNEVGVSIDRDNVKALILDIFSAGTDTTSTVLEWSMTELLRHPRIMKKLQNEVRSIGKGKTDIITEDDLEKMHYLKAVVKESLRYHPPIPLLVPRESSQDVEIMGYDIPAGTIVIINALAIGRDPKSWEDPEEFRPERFLNSCIDFKGHDFQFIPFGGGRRGCPGITFAMVTNELVLANIVHNFDWALPNGGKGEDLDMTESTGVTVHRKVPLFAVANSSS